MSQFGVPSLHFLGHLASSKGIQPLEEKVQVIRTFPQPTSQRKLRDFIGLVNFYRSFLPTCAAIMEPLHLLLTHPKDRSASLEWTEEALAAFDKTKAALADATLLIHPKMNAPTCLMTDASDIAIGAALQQFVDGYWQPIAFFPKKMKPAETRYSTFDRELLAIYLSIKHFRHFLEGRSFHVLMDHKPLTFALNSRPARYIWLGIKSDSRKWTRTCLKCQKSKVQRHTVTPLSTFTTPGIRFDHVHINIVDPCHPHKAAQLC